jgi:hypothetical protein
MICPLEKQRSMTLEVEATNPAISAPRKWSGCAQIFRSDDFSTTCDGHGL